MRDAVTVEDPQEENTLGFSRSPVWRLQKQYYENIDIAESWGSGDIPFEATSNPFIADRYARVILSYLLYLSASCDSVQINILETGVGHGRFSFMLIRRLLGLLEDRLPAAAFRYIMTDVSEKNLEAWKEHPKLQPFIEQGILEFAQLDVVDLHDTRLEIANTDLRTALNGQPLILISNFMLCALPYDIYRVKEDNLFHCCVSVEEKDLNFADEDPRSILDNLRYNFSYEPYAPGFYDKAPINDVLESYPDHISEGTFTYPIHIMNLYDFFSAACGAEMLWLITDEAIVKQSQLNGGRAVVGKIANGTLSNRVNLHALGLYIEPHNMSVHYPAHPDRNTDTYLLAPKNPALHQALQIKDGFTDQFRPKSYYFLMKSLSDAPPKLTADALIALFELTLDDPSVIKLYDAELLEFTQDIRGWRRRYLREAVARCWANHYDIGEEYDMAFTVGRLLVQLGSPRRAIPILRDCTQARPDNIQAWHALGKSYQARSELNLAIASFQRVLALDPSHQSARTQLQTLNGN